MPLKPGKRPNDWDEDEMSAGQMDVTDEDIVCLEDEADREDDPLQRHQLPVVAINSSFSIKDQQSALLKRFKGRPTVLPPAKPPLELRPAVNSASSEPNRVIPETEFDIFGKHVASQLKQLRPEHAVTAIGEISGILTQKRLASLFGGENPSSCGSVSSYPSAQDILTPITIMTSEDAEQS